MLLNKSRKASSRGQIQIKEVKDNILVLPNNQYRLVIETSSINFELKSEEEQDTLIDSFQSFLNALPAPLQIVIRIREIDIDAYIEQIAQNRSQEKDQVYKEQIDSYAAFIRKVVSGNKILSRRFYVVIPYHSIDRKHDFSIISEHLNLSRDIVLRGIEKLGMKGRQLNSIELLDLFYSFYNQSSCKTQQLKGQTIETILQNTYA